MSSIASPHPEGGLDVVVDADGALRVPADELARHGVRPGSHLRIVAEAAQGRPRRTVRGALASASAIGSDDVDALLRALGGAKADRITSTEQRWT